MPWAVAEALENRRLISGSPTAGPAFYGPLGGWLVAPAATGNPTTDTANLQNDLNLVGTAGYSNTLYIPAGTYNINQSLIFRGKSEVTVVGADPATTLIQWAGPTSNAGAQAMVVDYGNTITQFNRITLNGEGQINTGISDGYRPSSGINEEALGTLGNSGATGYYGVSFTTEDAAVKVVGVQLWIPANVTTAQTHVLELVDASTGQVVTNGSGTLSAGRNGGTSGAWMGVGFPGDIVLSPSHTYYLVAQEYNGGDSWYDDGSVMGADYVTIASVNGSVNNVSGSFGIVTAGNHAFGPIRLFLDTTGDYFPTDDQFLYDRMLSCTSVGFDVGAIGQAAETTLEGCQFSYCGNNTGNPIGSGGGVYLFGQNTIDWWIRNCEFDHDSVGIATNFGGYSMDVDNSVFQDNSLMDVYLPSGYSSAVRDSTSVGSAQFVGGGSGTAVVLQNDQILDPTSTTTPPINLQSAQLTLLDSAIRNNAGYSGADVAVTNGGDILSVDNLFGVSTSGIYQPYQYAGSAILDADNNQVVSLTSSAMTSLAPQALPPVPAAGTAPVIELMPTGVANTDTANLKSAISTAKSDIDAGASAAIIHLRGGLTTSNTTGSFNINSTLTIPAGYPIELLGDGAVYQSSGNSGTALSWSGPRGGTIIDLGGATLGVAAGPSCATIAGIGILGGDSAGDGIRIEDADQVGGNVYGDDLLLDTDGNDTPGIYTQAGLLADGLSNTNVQMADFTADGQSAVKVVGGGTSSGTGGQVGIFMGAGESTVDQYDVSNGGKLLVEDQYLEEDTGDTNQFMHLDNSIATIQGAEIKANVAGVDAADPPISVSGASSAAILSAQTAAGFIVAPGATSNVLAAGDGQWGSASGAAGEMGAFDGPLDYAPQSEVALLANGFAADQVNANIGNLNSFLQQMLSQTLANRVEPLSATPSRGTTDVRLYGVEVVSCIDDLHVVGSSGTPVSSNPPAPTAPAAPTGVTALTAGATGGQVDVAFTPGGPHLVASNDFQSGLGNAHSMFLTNSFTGSVGMQFTTGNTPVVVTQLGRYVVPGNNQSHQLQLIDSSNMAVIASAVLQTSGAQADEFGYVSLTTPVTLSPNTSYYLVSSETSGGDQYAVSISVDNTSIVKSINASGTLSGGVWTVTTAASSSSGFSNGPVDLVAEAMPHLSGEGATSGITFGSLSAVANNPVDAGLRFTTGPNAVTVAYLGRWIPKNTTTTQSHVLELVDPANGNAVVASATLPAGQSGGTAGQFAYVALASPVLLAPNHSYYLVCQEYNTTGSDQIYSGATQMAVSKLVASSDGSVTYNGTNWNFQADPTSTAEVYHYTADVVDLLAAVDPSPVSYNVYRSTNPNGAAAVLIASGLGTTSYVDTPGGAPGTTYYYHVTAVDDSGESAALGEPSASLGTALPSGWNDVDIGTPIPGAAWTNNANAASFTLQGSGSQLTQWNFAYQSIPTGSSFTETALVTSMNWVDGPTLGYDEFRAALMLRNGLSASGNTIGYVDVSASFAELQGTNGASNVTAPVWLQLRAVYTSANHTYSVTGWYSRDGVNWTAAGINSPVLVGLPAKLYVGLAVNSDGTSGVTTATFANVSVVDPSLSAPAAPTGLTAASNASGTAINLSWAPVSGAASYNVYRATTSGAETAPALIAGLTADSYTDSAVTTGMAYYYVVTAVGAATESQPSSEATAVAAQTPAITMQPINQSANAGQNVTFTAAASGNPAPTVQWQVSSNGGQTWANILGATSTTLAVNAVISGQNGNLYQAIFTNAGASATSSPATLRVINPVSVMSVIINGNDSALAGVQRSMVDTIVYTFSEAVIVAATGTDLNPGFAIAVHTGEQGTAPGLVWAAINPDADGASTQWVVTFTGSSVVGNSIANGVYDVTLNPSAVTSEAHPTAAITPRATDTFYRLYGDYNGDQVVNATDNLHFKTAITTYNPIFDYDNNGAVNATDNLHFKASISFVFNASFTPTT